MNSINRVLLSLCTTDFGNSSLIGNRWEYRASALAVRLNKKPMLLVERRNHERSSWLFVPPHDVPELVKEICRDLGELVEYPFALADNVLF